MHFVHLREEPRLFLDICKDPSRSYRENCKRILNVAITFAVGPSVTSRLFSRSRDDSESASSNQIESTRPSSSHRPLSFPSKLIPSSIIPGNNSETSKGSCGSVVAAGAYIVKFSSENYDGYTGLVKLACHNSSRHIYFASQLTQFGPYSRSGYTWFTAPTRCIGNGRLEM